MLEHFLIVSVGPDRDAEDAREADYTAATIAASRLPAASKDKDAKEKPDGRDLRRFFFCAIMEVFG